MKRNQIEDNAKLFEAIRTNKDRVIGEYYVGLKYEFIKNISSRYSCIDKEYLEDIYQESFAELGEKIISGKLTEDMLNVPVGAYLYGIGKIVAHKYVKIRDLISIGETADEETPNDIPDIIEEDSTLSQEDKELIREYVDRVAEPCSSVLRMFYFDEYTMFSIAKLMGYKSEDVAKSRKNKCMTKLKELIKKGLYGKFDIDTNN